MLDENGLCDFCAVGLDETQLLNLRHPTMPELEEARKYMRENLCDFELYFRNGKLLAGREPENDDWDGNETDLQEESGSDALRELEQIGVKIGVSVCRKQ